MQLRLITAKEVVPSLSEQGLHFFVRIQVDIEIFIVIRLDN